eukprot:TRINITY_DN6841_c0_g1_i1.p1 TRINITY_DN6841_c0_g1~~TRINITY_DN6841_c0_g1_i1.p1  ORF type:complete len:126 (+),score=31.50 TRINITY_DN6841_c0_g1_i1:74-451(+)
MELVAVLQDEAKIYSSLQEELQKLQTSKQKLMSQLSENEQVKKEMDLLPSDAIVYKLIGPTLLKQETDSAKQNVFKRIDFITAEIKRLGQREKDLSDKIIAQRKKVQGLQEKIQSIQRAKLQQQQ